LKFKGKIREGYEFSMKLIREGNKKSCKNMYPLLKVHMFSHSSPITILLLKDKKPYLFFCIFLPGIFSWSLNKSLKQRYINELCLNVEAPADFWHNQVFRK
jgi:hypothetical protein